METLYDELGISSDATADEIKKAYREKVKATHPDVGGKSEDFLAIQKAYIILSDDTKRSEYDSTGSYKDPFHNKPEMPPIEELARQLLSNVVEQVIVNSKNEDILSEVKVSVFRMIKECDNTLGNMTKVKVKVKKFISRLRKKNKKNKKKKNSLLIDITETHVKRINLQIEPLKIRLKVLKKVDKMIEKIEDGYEAPPPEYNGNQEAVNLFLQYLEI